MNHWIGQGRLSRDPEMRQAGSSQVCGFSIAVDRGKDREPLWMKCNAWGTLGERIHRYFKQGKPISVWGKLEPNEYDSSGGTVKEFELNVAGWGFVNFGAPKNESLETPPPSTEEAPY